MTLHPSVRKRSHVDCMEEVSAHSALAAFQRGQGRTSVKSLSLTDGPVALWCDFLCCSCLSLKQALFARGPLSGDARAELSDAERAGLRAAEIHRISCLETDGADVTLQSCRASGVQQQKLERVGASCSLPGSSQVSHGTII